MPQRNCFKTKCLDTISESCLTMNILRIQFYRIALKRLLYNTTSESCLEGNILGIQFGRIASKRKCWNTTLESCPKRMPSENAIPKNCLKENVVGCNLCRVL